MSKSILQSGHDCYYGCYGDLDKHHIFNGPLRQKSEHYGLWIYVEHYTHLNLHQTSEGQAELKRLKAIAQRAFEKKYSHDLFMKEFHKDYSMYLDDTDLYLDLTDLAF